MGTSQREPANGNQREIRGDGNQPTRTSQRKPARDKRRWEPVRSWSEPQRERKETVAMKRRVAAGNGCRWMRQTEIGEPSGGGRLPRGATLGRPPPPNYDKCQARSLGQPRAATATHTLRRGCAAACLTRAIASPPTHPCCPVHHHHRPRRVPAIET